MPFDGTQLDETAQVILRARELLEKGWCKNARKISGNEVRYCALGALAYAATGDAWSGDCMKRDNSLFYRGCKRLANALPKTVGSPGNIASYNNAQTSVEPILEWFDKAAMLVSR